MIGSSLNRMLGGIPPRWRLGLLGLALLAWLAGANSGAASGTTLVAPDPSTPGLTALGASPLSGLKLQIDSHGPDGYGYRPVTLRFNAPVPPKSALRVRVLFSAGGWTGSQSLMSVEQTFQYPAGAVSHEIVLDVPQHAAWQFHFWSVWVNGQLDRSLSVDQKSPAFVGGTTQINEKLLRIDLSQTGCVPTPRDSSIDQALQMVQQQGGNLQPLLEDYTGAVSANWLRMSAYDAIAISIDDLETLARSEPESLTSLKRWTAAGGALLVNGLKDSADARSSIDRLLGIRPQPLRELAESNVSGEAGSAWELTLIPGSLGSIPDKRFGLLGVDQPTRRDSQGRPAVWSRPYRFGRLVALSGGLPTVAVSDLQASAAWFRSGQGPAVDANVHPLIRLIRENGWGQRYGVNPEAGPTVEFSDWLLPGQGAAPVTLFRVMLTVFVLLVGPVNYWTLRAWGKQHLLVVTTPLLAALFTVALLGYALIADGLATKARVQSLTYLDQSIGEGVSWARLSYYAGIAPRQGLQVPREAMMIPVRAPGDQTLWGGDRGSNRLLIWNETQQLASGWLPSRTPTQFLQVYPYQTDLKLGITAEAQKVSARNGLGSDLVLLIVADPAGQLWMAGRCQADAAVQLKQVARKEAFKSLQTELLEREPAYPPGTSSADFERGSSVYQNFYGLYDPSASNVGFAGNRMATVLANLKGTSGKRVELEPRSYVAIAQTSQLVPLGTTATESASCHVILGSW